MTQPAIAKKPKIVPYMQRSPTLALMANMIVHYEMDIITPDKEIIKVPICRENCVNPLLLTDDIKKCTCQKCIGRIFQI